MTPEETLPSNSMSKTSIALHNLRGFVILIVIAFHSFLAYLAWQRGIWGKHDGTEQQRKHYNEFTYHGVLPVEVSC